MQRLFIIAVSLSVGIMIGSALTVLPHTTVPVLPTCVVTIENTTVHMSNCVISDSTWAYGKDDQK